MQITTQQYIRKPLVVEAVEVTVENFFDLVKWCQGTVFTSEGVMVNPTEAELGEAELFNPKNLFIQVRVHNPKNPRQTKAYVGDWILYTERGYKIYTPKAFKASFDPVEEAAA